MAGRKKSSRKPSRPTKKASRNQSRRAAKKKTAKQITKKRGAGAGKRKQAASRERAGQTPQNALKRKDFLRKLLLKKRNEIVAGLEEQMGRKLSLGPGQTIDSAMDIADLSTRDMEEDVANSLLEMKYGQYKDIADAFRKLQNDTYGLCEECSAEIGVKRLEVNPFARYCVSCKSRIEEFEKIRKESERFKD